MMWRAGPVTGAWLARWIGVAVPGLSVVEVRVGYRASELIVPANPHNPAVRCRLNPIGIFWSVDARTVRRDVRYGLRGSRWRRGLRRRRRRGWRCGLGR